METLVLDYTFRPAGKISWQRAITQFYKNKVEIISSYEDRDIRAPSMTMKMPAVIRELSRYKKKNAIRFSRENVYIRDKGTCQYCSTRVSRDIATYDHVIPREMGGKTKWDNIVIACYSCNQKKRNRTPEQAKMKLLNAPEKPKTLPSSFNILLSRSRIPIEWSIYLSNIQEIEAIE